MPNRVRRKSVVDMLAKVPVHRGSLLRSLDDLLKTIEISESAVMIPTLLRDKCQFDAWELLFVAKILKASILGHSDLVEFYMNHMGNQTALQQHQQQLNQANNSNEQQLIRVKTASSLHNLTSNNNNNPTQTNGSQSPASTTTPLTSINIQPNNSNNPSQSQPATSADFLSQSQSQPESMQTDSWASACSNGANSSSLSWISAATNGVRESITSAARSSNPNFVDCFPPGTNSTNCPSTSCPQPPNRLLLPTSSLLLKDPQNPITPTSNSANNSPSSNSNANISNQSNTITNIEQLASRLESSQTYNYSYSLSLEQAPNFPCSSSPTSGTPTNEQPRAPLPESGHSSALLLRQCRSTSSLSRVNSGASSPHGAAASFNHGVHTTNGLPGTPVADTPHSLANGAGISPISCFSGSLDLAADPSSAPVKLLLQIEQLKSSINHVKTLLESVVELYKKSIDNLAQ